MKGEGAQPTIDIEKQYNLDKYTKTEFTQQILKEFRKYGKKITKIEKYERMEKEGKTLNAEMKDLMGKKEKFTNHLTSLKSALELQEKMLKGKDASKEPSKPEPISAYVQPQVNPKNIIEEAARKLGYLFAISGSLKHKSTLMPNPFLSSKVPTPEQEAGLMKIYKGITEIREGQEISLAEEASRVCNIIKGILLKSGESVEESKMNLAELAEVIGAIADSSVVNTTRFKMTEVPERVISHPAPAELKPVLHPVSEPISQQWHEPKAVPKAEPKVEPAVPAMEARPTSWADEQEEAEEEEKAHVEPKKSQEKVVEPEEEEEDDGFTIIKDKKDTQAERRAAKETRRARRRGPSYRRYGEGAERGEETRGRRSPRRGGYRGDRRGDPAARGPRRA